MPKIDDYDFGRIVVDGVEQTRDVILLAGRVVPNWWRRTATGPSSTTSKPSSTSFRMAH
jgi:hypothetical protein